jgi:hypothetical protein
MLVACAAGVPPAATATIAADPQAAARRVTAFLEAEGFAVPAHAAPPAIHAEAPAGSVSPEWVDCQLVLYPDRYPGDVRRFDWAKPSASGGAVDVHLEPAAGGTAMTVRASFRGSYRNRFSNTGEEAACGSTGALERQLLDAAGS